jgi:hypothetical protein
VKPFAGIYWSVRVERFPPNAEPFTFTLSGVILLLKQEGTPKKGDITMASKGKTTGKKKATSRKKVKVNDLPPTEQELTAEQAKAVRGGVLPSAALGGSAMQQQMNKMQQQMEKASKAQGLAFAKSKGVRDSWPSGR